MAAPQIESIIAFELYTGWSDTFSNFIMNYFGSLDWIKTRINDDTIDLGAAGIDNGYGNGLAQYQP